MLVPLEYKKIRYIFFLILDLYLDEFLRPVIHLVIPLYVGDDAGHVHLALERRGLPGAGRHVVHDVLDVGLAARFDWKRERKNPCYRSISDSHEYARTDSKANYVANKLKIPGENFKAVSTYFNGNTINITAGCGSCR